VLGPAATFLWLSPAGRFTAVTLAGLFHFQPPPPRTVRAVLPHTAHRRRSPPAFGLSHQGFPALGATGIPYKLTRPRSHGDALSITCRPK
jgi:hypothetical protein